jgi:hypothetical protein
MRAAAANTLAEEEQAVDTTTAGPSRPKYSRVKPATEYALWVVAYLKSSGRAPVAAPVGQFQLQHAGGAGAEDHGNPALAVATSSGTHRVGEAIRLQAEQRQPVVAALVARQRSGQFHVVDARHLADPGIQPHRLEVAMLQPAGHVLQPGARRRQPAAEAGGGSEVGKQQGSHGSCANIRIAQFTRRQGPFRAAD